MPPAFDHEKLDWPRSPRIRSRLRNGPSTESSPCLDDGRVRWESDSATRQKDRTCCALQEKVGKGPGEAKRLSFSKVRAEAPNGELKVELRGGNVALIDLKKDDVGIKLKQDNVERKNAFNSSARSTGHQTAVTSRSGVKVRCLSANTSLRIRSSRPRN